MSIPPPSRRMVLTALSTGALSSIAGCSSLPSFGDEKGTAYRNWLYDPINYPEEEVRPSLWFESPTDLEAAEEHLHDRARNRHLSHSLSNRLDRSSVEWNLVYHCRLLNAPAIRAYGGSFDEQTARETTESYGVDDAESLGSIDGYEMLAFDEDQYGLYRDGEAVNVSYASAEEVRGLLSDEEGSPTSQDDTLQPLLDRIGFETTASIRCRPAETAGYVGYGSGYAVDGDTTTARFAQQNGDMSLGELRELGDDIDALSAVTVDEDGPVRWLEGTVDTDRILLNGTMFDIGETPLD